MHVQGSFTPDKPTSICNDIKFVPNGNSSDDCQGFVYDTQQKIAFFKPQPVSGLLGTGDLCANPTTYTWLLTVNRGQLCCINCYIELHVYSHLCMCLDKSRFTCNLDLCIANEDHVVVDLRGNIALYPDAHNNMLEIM